MLQYFHSFPPASCMTLHTPSQMRPSLSSLIASQLNNALVGRGIQGMELSDGHKWVSRESTYLSPLRVLQVPRNSAKQKGLTQARRGADSNGLLFRIEFHEIALSVTRFCIIEPMPDEINGVPAPTLFYGSNSIGKGLGSRIETREHAGLQVDLLGP